MVKEWQGSERRQRWKGISSFDLNSIVVFSFLEKLCFGQVGQYFGHWLFFFLKVILARFSCQIWLSVNKFLATIDCSFCFLIFERFSVIFFEFFFLFQVFSISSSHFAHSLCQIFYCLILEPLSSDITVIGSSPTFPLSLFKLRVNVFTLTSCFLTFRFIFLFLSFALLSRKVGVPLQLAFIPVFIANVIIYLCFVLFYCFNFYWVIYPLMEIVFLWNKSLSPLWKQQAFFFSCLVLLPFCTFLVF